MLIWSRIVIAEVNVMNEWCTNVFNCFSLLVSVV